MRIGRLVCAHQQRSHWHWSKRMCSAYSHPAQGTAPQRSRCLPQVFNIVKLLSLPCMPAVSTASSNAALVWVLGEFQYTVKGIVNPPKGKHTPENQLRQRSAVMLG